jgi:hypothetical protein
VRYLGFEGWSHGWSRGSRGWSRGRRVRKADPRERRERRTRFFLLFILFSSREKYINRNSSFKSSLAQFASVIYRPLTKEAQQALPTAQVVVGSHQPPHAALAIAFPLLSSSLSNLAPPPSAVNPATALWRQRPLLPLASTEVPETGACTSLPGLSHLSARVPRHQYPVSRVM